MKRFFTLLALCIPMFLAAQDNEGVIYFDEVLSFKAPENSEDDNPRWARMREMMGESQSFGKVLYFSESASSYQVDPAQIAEEEEVPGEERNPMRMMRRFMNAENIVYRDFKKEAYVESQEFMGRKFLINGEDSKAWKMTGEQKMILDYPCMKAEFSDSNGTVEVWFTPNIPVASGPRSIGGLPGMVLETTMRDGRFTITAKKIDFRKVKKNEMIVPEKGKKVTREEYREIVRKKMEEMREQWGGRRGPGMGH